MGPDATLTLGTLLIVAVALVVTVSILFNRSMRISADDSSVEIETQVTKADRSEK